MDQLLDLSNKKWRCDFCGAKRNDHLKFGPKYTLGNIKAHYYCVLLSHRLYQNGNDEEGMLGFLLPDIQEELRRSLKTSCCYCGRGRATICCAAKKCRKSFHLPCGLKNGSLHQFINEFKSFCGRHRPTQQIPSKILGEASKNNPICCICYDTVKVKDKNTLWAPCCLKTWYHRACVQKLANSSGYFFKCAACNDEQKFKQWMQRFGIFIPQQDASWERVPNAFQELLFRYDRCDAEICKCPEGRKKNEENTIWEIALCVSCGSQGIHIACGKLKFLEPEWECETCRNVTRNLKTGEGEAGQVSKLQGERRSAKPGGSSSVLLRVGEVSQRKRGRSSDDLENYVLDKRKKRRMNSVEEEDEEDFEIDVENVEETKDQGTQTGPTDDDDDMPVVVEEHWTEKFADIEEALTSIKPGPLSYKLSLICGKLKGRAFFYKSKKSNGAELDVIDLTGFEEEAAGGGNKEVIDEREKEANGVEAMEEEKNRNCRKQKEGQQSANPATRCLKEKRRRY